MPSPLELLRHPAVRGHPLHAILSDLPAALIPAAALAEFARRVSPRGEPSYLSDVATVTRSRSRLPSESLAAAIG
jgi:hypothetical protein